MSDNSEALNKIADANMDTVSVIGSHLGTLANIGGTADLIKTVLELLLKGNDETLAKLNELQETLKQNFALLNAGERARRIVDRENLLNDAFRLADQVVTTLTADLDHGLTWDAKSLKIGYCSEALDTLDYFRTPHNWRTFGPDEIYYRDPWTGMEPAWDPSTSLVFTDRYLLPDYLRLVYIFLLVIKAFDPDYRTNYVDTLRRCIAVLQRVHDISSGGIVRMLSPFDFDATPPNNPFSPEAPPPPPDSPLRPDSGSGWWYGIGFNDFANPTRAWDFGRPTRAYHDDGVEYYQPVGAVHVYSGASASTKFPPLPNDNRVATRATTKVAIAARARWKDLYQSIGLTDVWDAINQLRAVVGDRPLGPDVGRSWSLKELTGLLRHRGGGLFPQLDRPEFPVPAVGGPGSGPISVLQTINALATLSGLDTDPASQPVLSLRDALNTAALRDRVDDVDRWWGDH